MGGGGWQWSLGPQDDTNPIAAIHAAPDQGINWIDTAAVYGLGHSGQRGFIDPSSWWGMGQIEFANSAKMLRGAGQQP
jgi:hypothetical protein